MTRLKNNGCYSKKNEEFLKRVEGFYSVDTIEPVITANHSTEGRGVEITV